MDIQMKIKQQAEKQHQIRKELTDFITRQEIIDKDASNTIKKFNPDSIVLPAPRGTVDANQDAQFEKNRGNQFFKDKKYKDAAECYEIGLGSDDNILKSQCYFNLGLCFQKLGRKPMESLACFKHAVELDSNYNKARQKYAKSLMENNLFQEAYDQFIVLNDTKNVEDIAICQAQLNEAQAEIESSSSEEQSLQINKNVKVVQQNTLEEKKKQMMKETDAKILNTEILGTVGGKLVYKDDLNINSNATPLEFFSRFREFVSDPNILLMFLDQFHTVVLQKHFETIQKQITPKDITQLLLACKYGSKIMKTSKMVNLLYNISDIDGINRIIRLLPLDEITVIKQVMQLFKQWVVDVCEEDKKEVFDERILCIEDSWLSE